MAEFRLNAQADHSANLKGIFRSLDDGELSKLTVLADKIERGDADNTDEEAVVVYDAFVEAMNYVIDLANMCRRREELAVHHGYSFVARENGVSE